MKEPMSKISIGTSDAVEAMINEFVITRNSHRQNSITRKADVLCSRKDFLGYIQDNYTTEENYRQVQVSRQHYGIVFTPCEQVLIEWRADYNQTTVNFLGDPDTIKSERTKLMKVFEEVECQIKWVFSADGNSISVPVTEKYKPLDEMYPFLNVPIAEYYDSFQHSDCSTLLLIGPPGTGKTSFIRGYLMHTKSDALVTYDEKILSNDFVFADFAEGKENAMIIEDADNFLRSRKEGNNMMQKFLNLGSGLVSNDQKKLIFSTNLENIDDIDAALIRPGRCFDVMMFRPLTAKEASVLAKKLKLDDTEFPERKEGYTIAEVFNRQMMQERTVYEVNTKPSFGFI